MKPPSSTLPSSFRRLRILVLGGAWRRLTPTGRRSRRTRVVPCVSALGGAPLWSGAGPLCASLHGVFPTSAPGRGGPADKTPSAGSRVTCAMLSEDGKFGSMLVPRVPQTITPDSSMIWDAVDQSRARLAQAMRFWHFGSGPPGIVEKGALRAPNAVVFPQHAANHPVIPGSG